MPITTLAFNFKNGAPSQFESFLANSASIFKDKLYFASDNGVHVFDPESDEEVVPAVFTLPLSDLGYLGQKTPRSLIIGGRISGAMRISVTDESGVTKHYLTPELQDADGCKVALDSDQRSRYLKISISNINGADFSIDFIDLIYIPGPEPRR